jgi:hypothetical protein
MGNDNLIEGYFVPNQVQSLALYGDYNCVLPNCRVIAITFSDEVRSHFGVSCLAI